MPLLRCDEWWGGVHGHGGIPQVEEHSDVTYVPWGRIIPHNANPDWGVFDRQGALIDAATFRRGAASELVGQRLDIPPLATAPEPAPEATYIYGGPAFSHYGHFTCTTLARLWFVSSGRRRGKKVLFHSHESVEQLFGYPHVASVLGAIGLEPADVVVFDEPRRIEKLIVPRPAFQEQTFVYECFRELGLVVGDRLGARESFGGGMPLYLTKMNLKTGVHRFEGERNIVDVLLAKGVEVLAPEELSLKTQIDLFSSGRPIFGPASSAFHTALFGTSLSKTVCLCPKKEVNSNFALFDLICLHQAEYYYSEGSSENYNRADFFNVIDLGSDPAELALQLYDAAAGG